MMRSLCLATLACLLAFSGTASADERILAFDSAIVVAADASMQVTETIRVRSEGVNIKHGLYRDFPTDYRDRHGNRVHVEFEPQSLTRDGQAEPFHNEQRGNGVRVYFGSKDVFLMPGEHTYALRYRTTRQLGFFGDRDELYWNATGNGWDFPIDHASATLTWPGAIPVADIQVEAYTGVDGAKGTDYVAQADAPSHAQFHTTRALAPREGLTVVASFPRGAVMRADAGQRIGWFLRDNRGVMVVGIGGLLLLFYYFSQWLRVGRDPKAGVIIPQYEAPAGFTPGALRRIERMGWDNGCVAADLVDLGVRGALEIHQDGRVYQLVRAAGANEPLPPAEADLLEALLPDGRQRLVLVQAEHTAIAAALKVHRERLAKDGAGRYFKLNIGVLVMGALFSLAVLALGVFALGPAARRGDAGFMLIWLGAWSIGVCVLLGVAANAWKEVLRKRAGLGTAVAMSVFALPFLAGEVAGMYFLGTLIGFAFPLAVLVLVALNVLFGYLMKAPTLEGRRLLDRIAGLRLYLGVAERDDLALAKAPPMDAGEFQRFLPYALALGVEKTWADRFAAAVGPAAVAATAASMSWYHGGDVGRISNLGSFTSSLGSSFSSAISSSSSAPGSSSGSGGGGSSGGGGGGGGGGGW